ncbi:MAG: DNA repair protein RadC [Actinobacteria bacterium]|nr:DNA repair protein RadC [Actinomycetota bacterium]
MTWTTGPDAGMLRLAQDPSAAHHGCLRCAAEASRHVRLADIDERPQVTSPEDAARIVLGELAGRDREHCVATLLDTKHRMLSVVTVSVGSVDHTFMRPREILRDALLANAAAVVVAHNHPSGDPEPSRDDELVSRRIVRAGEVVGIDVLDHLVVGGARWVSLARRGLL